MVSVDVKQHSTDFRAQEQCGSRGGRPGLLPVPNSPYGLCGRKATLNDCSFRVQELFESRTGRPGLSDPGVSWFLWT